MGSQPHLQLAGVGQRPILGACLCKHRILSDSKITFAAANINCVTANVDNSVTAGKRGRLDFFVILLFFFFCARPHEGAVLQTTQNQLGID